MIMGIHGWTKRILVLRVSFCLTPQKVKSGKVQCSHNMSQPKLDSRKPEGDETDWHTSVVHLKLSKKCLCLCLRHSPFWHQLVRAQAIVRQPSLFELQLEAHIQKLPWLPCFQLTRWLLLVVAWQECLLPTLWWKTVVGPSYWIRALSVVETAPKRPVASMELAPKRRKAKAFQTMQMLGPVEDSGLW